MYMILLDVIYARDFPVIALLLELKMHLIRGLAMLARDGHSNRCNAIIDLDVRGGRTRHCTLCLIESLRCCGKSSFGCLLSIRQRNGTGVKVGERFCIVLLFD